MESSRASGLSDTLITELYGCVATIARTIDTFGIRACEKSCVDWHVLIGYARVTF